MIHIMIGTKAQFIKMAPIMQELDRRGIRFNFIDTGQHAVSPGTFSNRSGCVDPTSKAGRCEQAKSKTGQRECFSIFRIFSQKMLYMCGLPRLNKY